MTQIYKVIKPVEIGNKKYRLGEEVALRAREAETLMAEGVIANTRNGFPDTAAADEKNAKKPEQSREPDMATKKDADMVAESDARAESKHAELEADAEAREESRNERQAEVDAEYEEKLVQVCELAAKKTGEDCPASTYRGKTAEELDTEMERLNGLPDPAAKKATAKKTTAKKATK